MDLKLLNLLRGVTFCLLWYCSIFFGFVVLYCPLLPVLLFSNYAFRYLTDKIFAFWELYPTVLLEMLFGTKICVYGDYIDPEETSIIVMNHRTRVDWNYLWLCMYHASRKPNNKKSETAGRVPNGKLPYQNGGLHVQKKSCDMNSRGLLSVLKVLNQDSRLKYVLKDEIRHIPGPGWVMQMNCFTYIKRNWVHDEAEMKRVANYLDSMDYTYQLLIFPEGTDLTESSMKKSDSFAKKNQLMMYKQVLHPRTRGFNSLVQTIRPRLSAVYDISIAYSSFNKWNVNTEVGSCCLKDMILGQFPAEVHFSIKKYSESVVPEDDDSLTKWLNDRWDSKEKQLEDFYRIGRFTNPGKCLNNFDRFELVVAFSFWTALVFAVPILLHHFETFRWMLMACCLSFFVLNVLTGGFHHIEMTWYDLKRRSNMRAI